MSGGAEAASKAFFILLQHLAVRVLDKAEFMREAFDSPPTQVYEDLNIKAFRLMIFSQILMLY